jgi:geranylgeranyl transferase type-2 subunit beta
VGPDGRVEGDQFGEFDVRFSYIFVMVLSLLGRLDAMDTIYDGKGRQLVVDNIVNSMNFDGAFGSEPGAESHGAMGEFESESESESDFDLTFAPTV